VVFLLEKSIEQFHFNLQRAGNVNMLGIAFSPREHTTDAAYSCRATITPLLRSEMGPL
jgi:hypothetical protein